MIDGVKTKKLRVIPDERGWLMEILRNDDDIYQEFGQVYMTTAYPGVTKAWHMHKKQTDNFTCIHGMMKVDSHVVKGWWKDTGKPENVLDANHLILDVLESKNNGEVEEGAELSGRVYIGAGTKIKKNSVIRGPAIIGENCQIDAYIGPYTSIGDNSVIIGGEIESSIVVGDAVIQCNERIVDSLIGNHSHIVSKENNLPKGHRFIIGENSMVNL